MTWIYSCPDCGRDLEPDDGVGLWCGFCEHYLPADSFDDPDDWRDRMIDEREAARDGA